MAQPVIQRRIYRFGVFEFDADNKELRKRGVRIQLQPQPLATLELLIERPAEIVSREELRRKLWGDDIHVDFESGLNTTVNRLRLKLSDSAETPRYIETIARTGYRFIAPVERVPTAEPTAELAELTPAPQPPRSRARTVAIVAALAVAAAVLLYTPWRRPSEARHVFRQLTFRHGKVLGARFGPARDEIVYSAQWDGQPRQVYVTDSASVESRPVGFAAMALQSVSSTRELLLLSSGGTMNIGGGNLFRVPLNGSAPAQIDHGIMSAEWAPDGNGIALIRAIDGKNRVEFPPGKILYETSGWLSGLRFSSASRELAFIEHPVRHDDTGHVRVLLAGKPIQTIGGEWASITGLCWNADTTEIWVSASRAEGPRSLWSLTRTGRIRSILHSPGSLTLKDIAPGGRVLLIRDDRSLEMAGKLSGHDSEHDLSWLDWSRIQEISADGSRILFDEDGDAHSPEIIAYIRLATETVARQLGPGVAMALSPDAKSALLATPDRHHLKLVSIDTGAKRNLPDTGLFYQWAKFYPDGGRLLVLANAPAKGLRLYTQDLDSGRVATIGPEMMIRNAAISHDGIWVAVLSPGSRLLLYPTAGGDPREIPTTEPLAPIRWSSDSRSLLVQRYRSYTDIPAHVLRIDVRTGMRTPWKAFSPANPSGVDSITGIVISADEKSYSYSYRRVLSTLYLATGLTPNER